MSRFPFKPILALALLLPLPSPARAQQAIDAAGADVIVQEAMKAWQVPGAAIAIVQGNDLVYDRGYGVKDLASKEPVTADTLFACASTSKAFTATCIALLVEEGKMKWDDPVRKHVEYFRLSDPLAGQNVTLRDLVCHRTGLSRHDLLWLSTGWGREEIIRRIGHVPLTQPFRTTYQYQNIMYLTAGQAVGAASKSSWDDFVKQRIFNPLGMAGANTSVTAVLRAPDRATPHRKTAGMVEPVAWRNIDNVAPAGSVNAGVRDLSRWVRFQLGDGTFEGKRILDGKLLQELHAPQMVIPMDGPTGVSSFTRAMNPDTNQMSYAHGWTVQDYRGHLLVSHGGSIDGFRAQVALLPRHHIGIIVLSNLGQTSFPEAVRNSLADHLLRLPKKDWNAHYQEQAAKNEANQKAADAKRDAARHKGTKPSRALAAYAGCYDDPAYGSARVSEDNGTLTVAWHSAKAKLDHFHFDTFTARFDQPVSTQQLVFTLAADGEVAKLGFLGQEFKRVKEKK